MSALRTLAIVFALIAGLLSAAGARAGDEKLTLGVLAMRPVELLANRYQPLADYLSAQLNGTRIELRVLDRAGLDRALERNELDFLLTNPGHYLIVRSQNSLSGALATLVSMEGGRATASLGGVIVVRADNRGVQRLADLRERQVAFTGSSALGGYMVQAYELMQAGLKLPDELKLQTVRDYEEVVDVVLGGRAEVGFLRTGVIEDLAHAGKLDPAKLRVINPQPLAGYPYQVSTRLYPEWPFVALPHVDERVTRKVASALLAMEPGHAASRAAGIAGFAPPADYLPVENLARVLHVPPYEQPVEVTPADVWERYWPWVSGLCVLFALILLLSMRLGAGNRRLAAAKREIEAVAGSLARERQHLATLVQTLPDLVWLKDESGVYLDCNTRFESLFGASKATIVGRTDYDFVDREQADAFRANDQRAIEKGGPSVNEEWVTYACDGHRELLETTKVPMRAADGALIGVLGIAHDITEHRRLQQELSNLNATLEERVEERTHELFGMEQRAMAILQSSAAGLFGVDVEGRIIFINDAACSLLGTSVGDSLGQLAHEKFHHRHADGTPYPIGECRLHCALCAGEAMHLADETYWRVDGRPLPVMVWTHPMYQDGRHVGAVVSFVDMTQQYDAQRAKDEALAAAEHLARVRSEFVANMSHEIRTPLNGILGFADIGLRSLGNEAKVANALVKVQQSGKHLLGVINDVLDFSKIEAGKLPIAAEVVALHECLTQTVDMVREQAAGKGLALRLEIDAGLPAYGIGDALRLQQVLLNLLSNAVKFTDVGSVTLAASLRGADLLLRVSDTGIGMTATQVATVFDPFVQADTSATRRFGGTGLGLSITKRLVTLMGGEITVDSSPGGGTRFEVALPFQTAAAQAAGAGPAHEAYDKARTLQGLSVLVAEDNPLNREILVENLTLAGARVVAVENGQDAWERVIDDGPKSFDVVLMDVQMPVMGGYEATERILSIAPGLPIIGQTAHAYGEDRERCFAAGMVGHIAKPIDAAALVALLRQYIREPALD